MLVLNKVSLFNGISTFVVYLILKLSLEKNNNHTTQPIAREKGIHSFPKCIRPKVNVIRQMEFELTHFKTLV